MPEHILCDEVHQVTVDGETGFISIKVTSAVAPPVLKTDLGAVLAGVVRDQCYPQQDEPQGRTATFAGVLNFGDATLDETGGLVTIDSGPPDRTEALKGLLLSEQFRAALRAMPPRSQVQRSARPFTIGHQSWVAEFAGLGAEDVGRLFAQSTALVAADDARLPGDALEVWLLPVTEFRFEYLITPAGEWPPSEGTDD